MNQLDIRLFGRVIVSRDGVDLHLPGRRVRTLLTLLALRAGSSVPAEVLGRGIWGELPPQRLRGSLHTCVTRLRTVIGHDLIASGPTGYALQVPRRAVDVLRFLDALETVDEESPSDEARRLRDALDLWVDEPFGEPLSDWLERSELPRLVERRLLAVERLVDLDLATGRQNRWLDELSTLVEEHPLRESLWLLHLRTLHSSGRRAEALKKYDELRALLSEELGTDPAEELQRMHQLLLREPLHLDAYDDGPDGTGPTPRQLPMQVSRFVGRADESAGLGRLLNPIDSVGDGGAEVAHPASGMVAVIGTGGVGKTSLVLNWARENEAHFSGGHLFVNLGGHGAGPPLTPAEALSELLRGLGVPGRRIPDSVADRSALLRTETAGRRVLVVLDDARDSEQIRPLLPGTGATVLITSRNQLRGLAAREGMPRLTLRAMKDAEAVALLESRLGQVVDPADLRELAELCGHLPLALAVAAERAGRDQSRALTQLNEQLRDEHARLDVLSAGEETGVRAVLDWSYKRLDVASARLFRLLGLQRCGFVSTPGAAALSGLPEPESAVLLDRLADSSLLTAGWPGWYQIHDLTRLYALSLLDQVADGKRVADGKQDKEKEEAIERLQSWYVHSARNACNLLRPARVEMTLRARPTGVVPQEFDSPRTAHEWLSAQHRSMSVMIADAVETGDHRLIAELAPSLHVRLTLLQARTEQIDLCRTNVRAGEAEGDPRMIGLAAGLLGNALNHSGHFEEAGQWYGRARQHLAEAGDAQGELAALGNEGMILVARGNRDEGIPLLEAALEQLDVDGEDRDARALNNLAWAYGMEGRIEEGLACAREALATLRLRPNVNVLAETNCLDTLAMILCFRGSYSEACTALVEAIELYRSIGDLHGEVLLSRTLGVAQRDAGWHHDAKETWGNALRLIDAAPAWMHFEPDDITSLLDGLARTPQVPAPRTTGESWPSPIH